MDMVRVAQVSHTLKAIARAPDSWHTLHLHEMRDDALQSLMRTFPDALRSAREIWVSVLYGSKSTSLGAFLNGACSSTQGSSTHGRSATLQPLETTPVDHIVCNDNKGADSESATPASLPSHPSHKRSTAIDVAVDAIGRLPNQRLRRLYVIDVDLCDEKLATLSVLFPRLNELVIVEHGLRVPQVYDAGSILTWLISDWPCLRSLTVRFAGGPPLHHLCAVATLRIPPTLVQLCISAWRVSDTQPIETATAVAGADIDASRLPHACRMRIELPRKQKAALDALRLEDTHICRLSSVAIDDPLPCLTQLYATAGAFTDTQTLTRLLATRTLCSVTLERMRLEADLICMTAPPQPEIRSLTLRGCETPLDFIRAVARQYTHLEDFRVVDCEKDGGGGATGDWVQSLQVVNSDGPHVTSVIDVDRALACLAGAGAFIAGRLLHVQMPYSPDILLAPPPLPPSSASVSSSSSSPSPSSLAPFLPSSVQIDMERPSACRSSDAKLSGKCNARCLAGCDTRIQAVTAASALGVGGMDDRSPHVELATTDDVRHDLEVVDWRADTSVCRAILWNKTDPSGTRAPPDAVSVRSSSSRTPREATTRFIVTNFPFASRCETLVYSPGLALLTAAGTDCAVTFGRANVVVYRGAVPCNVRASSALPLRHWSVALVRAMQIAETTLPLSDRSSSSSSSSSPSLPDTLTLMAPTLLPSLPVVPKARVFAVRLENLGQVTHVHAQEKARCA
jgi:hypothetical protein